MVGEEGEIYSKLSSTLDVSVSIQLFCCLSKTSRMKREEKHEYLLTITKTFRQQKVRLMLKEIDFSDCALLNFNLILMLILFTSYHVYPPFPIF